MSIPTITVSELNRTARSLLEDAFPRILVQGELSNLAKPSSGHLYFSLKDDKAQVRCALFKSRYGNNTLDFSPKDGQEVIVRANVSLYEPRGDYQLIVEHMVLAGEGALRQAFEQLKNKLAAEGLFSQETKKPLPRFPQKIGIITSPTGAAIRDILSVLQRRYPLAEICIYPTAVQGVDAAPQIVKALKQADTDAHCDVILLARGGGSLEDLWPFNEEIVARAIHACKIPIISGVGHETDTTIADFVADLRAPTPSAAAEHAVPDWQIVLQTFNNYISRLTVLIKRILQTQNQTLDNLTKRLQVQHPGQKIEQAKTQLNTYTKQLITLMRHYLETSQTKLANLARMLDTVSPLTTLSRGYAIVKLSETGEVIREAKQVKPGHALTLILAEGEVHAQVT